MRRLIALICTMSLFVGLCGGCSWDEITPPDVVTKEPVKLGFQFERPEEGEEFAILHTDGGDIYVRLFPDQAPKAVENFKTLAKNGYYDGVIFHRIMADMFLQTGDPTGVGTGGESCWGGWFEDEISDVLGHFRGSLAMANGGVDLNGSQFFINQAGVEMLPISAERQYYEAHKDVFGEYFSFEEYFAAKTEYITGDTLDPTKLTAERLDAYDRYGGNIALDGNVKAEGGYTVFGQVFYGMAVVDALASVEVDDEYRPTELVCIDSIDFAVFQSAFYPHISGAETEVKNTVKTTDEPFGFQLEAPAVGEEIAVIHTNKGDMSVRLFPEHAPKAVENFKALIEEHYYDGVSMSVSPAYFAAVDADSLAELHDGVVKLSSFDELFEDEFTTSLGNLYGSLAMTNGGPNANGTRFFINNGKPVIEALSNMRSFYDSQQGEIKEYYLDMASYFADESNMHIGQVTDEILAVYEEHGGNISRDGALSVTGGNTVFAQVFDGLDVVATITETEVGEDGSTPVEEIVIESMELTTYEG